LEIVCPFCPLRCHDLAIDSSAEGWTLEDHGCSLAKQRLALLHLSQRGRDASNGLASGAQLIQIQRTERERGSIVVGGTILDVQTARAAIRFAAEMQARLDVVSSAGEKAFMSVGEREGWMGATLGELAGRADSLVCIGPVEKHFPRLVERFFEGPLQSSLQPRRLFHLEVEDTEQLKRRLSSALTVYSKTRGLQPPVSPDRFDDQPFLDWLATGEYIAFVWGTEDDAGRGLDRLAANLLRELVSELNLKRRAVLIPLSESTTFRNVAAWLTGFSGPLDFQGSLPRLLDSDALMTGPLRVWLQPFPDAALPPEDGAKLIVIGAADDALARRADAYIRAAIPGLEAHGTTIRGDGTVTMPFAPPAESKHPLASHVMSELVQSC
jgi:formylmethanofuran dehydrogenase subunit B